jgi:hypothetical protein
MIVGDARPNVKCVGARGDGSGTHQEGMVREEKNKEGLLGPITEP